LIISLYHVFVYCRRRVSAMLAELVAENHFCSKEIIYVVWVIPSFSSKNDVCIVQHTESSHNTTQKIQKHIDYSFRSKYVFTITKYFFTKLMIWPLMQILTRPTMWSFVSIVIKNMPAIDTQVSQLFIYLLQFLCCGCAF